jgi:hypothetical protein
MVSRHVVLGCLILLVALIVVSAVWVFVLDALRAWRERGRDHGRSDKE